MLPYEQVGSGELHIPSTQYIVSFPFNLKPSLQIITALSSSCLIKISPFFGSSRGGHITIGYSTTQYSIMFCSTVSTVQYSTVY